MLGGAEGQPRQVGSKLSLKEKGGGDVAHRVRPLSLKRQIRWITKAVAVVSLVALLVSGVSLSPPVTASGSELDELQRQQQQIGEQIQDQQNALAQAESKVKELSQKLGELEQSIRSIEADLRALDREKQATEAQIQATQKQLEQAEQELEYRSSVLGTRLRDIYKNGQISYIEVLLQSASISDFLVRLDLLKRIAQQDKLMVEQVKAQRQRIAEQKAQLVQQKQRIEALSARIQRQRQSLADRHQEQAQLLALSKAEKQKIARALDQLEAESRQIAARIREIQSRNRRNIEGSGTSGLAWPVPGYFTITSNFGWRIHPLLGDRRFHDGVDIGAPTGATVVAAQDGIVIMATYYGGYGNCIIIDHGGGFATMYGHLSAFLVSSGQRVSKGQAIGRVGSTGWSTGPHLHFGIRLDGEPTDSLRYY